MMVSRLTLLLTCLAVPALAQSAVVGRVHTNGTIELYNDRFQNHFDDGTPVARLEVAGSGATANVTRWAHDGCRGEMTALVVGSAPAVGGWRPLWIVSSQPLSLYSCQDLGCFLFTDNYDIARCRSGCKCMKNGDLVGNGLCKKVFNATVVNPLSDWVQVQFIQ